MSAATQEQYEFFSESQEFKAYTETKENGETEHFVEGYISTHDKDLVNDIVTEKGMADMLKQIREHNIKIDFEHEAWKGDTELEEEISKTTNPVGRIVEAEQDSKGIKAKMLINDAHKRFDEVWGSIKNKMLDAFSIAFTPEEKRTATDGSGEEVRLLDKVNLLNIALTGNPVNREAKMTDVMTKALNDDMKSDNEVKQLKSRVESLENQLEDVENVKNQLKSFKNNVMSGDKEDTDGKSDAEVKGEDLVEEVKNLSDTVSDLKSQLEEQENNGQNQEQKGNYSEDEEEDEEETKSEFEDLKNEVEELKSQLDQPDMKGLGNPENEDEQETKGQDSQGPLDYVA